MLTRPIRRSLPSHSLARELLHRRPQLGRLQREVVHRPDPQDTSPRETRADPIHQGAASRAEVIRHGVARADSL